MDGLANYDRQEGYVNGSVNLEWQTMTMTQDRGRFFTLDAMEVDESNFVMAAGDVMGQFQRVKVIPEVDAYRISKIFTLAGNRSHTYAPAASSIFKELCADIAMVRDKIGDGDGLVVTLSIPVAALLSSSTEMQKQINVGEFRRGEVFTKVKMLDGIPLLEAPSSRMKSAFVFYDGVTPSDGAATNPTPDQTKGGFVPAADALDINWMITAKSAPIGVSKTDTIRIFEPNTHQKANAWRLDYRKYHDLWVPDNKLDGLFVNHKA